MKSKLMLFNIFVFALFITSCAKDCYVCPEDSGFDAEVCRKDYVDTPIIPWSSYVNNFLIPEGCTAK